jgi:hypothetical protein
MTFVKAAVKLQAEGEELPEVAVQDEHSCV